MTNKANTLIAVLRERGLDQPSRLAYTFLSDGESNRISITYAELERKARAIGALLQSLGAAGERVLLLYPPGLEYIQAFFGCLYARAVAVPAYPPRINQSLARLEAIESDCQPKFALTDSRILAGVGPLLNDSVGLRRMNWQTLEGLSAGIESDWQEPGADGDSLALLQYTSGSTGTPKGVMLTHENLLQNSMLLGEAFEYDAESCCVSWLPVYHDMGLIGGVLQPLHGGFPCTLMSPVHFLQKPLRWLQAISQYGGTISGAPNFAYDLCVNKIRPEECEQLDLNSWDVAFNGSEPVRQETMKRFAAAFAPYGFRPEAFYPCYGLAEATLFVSGGTKSKPPVVKALSGKMLELNHAVEVNDDKSNSNNAARFLVSCGQARSNQHLAIVHPDSLEMCPPGEIGEVWVSSPSVAQGYWNKPAETERSFQAYIAKTGAGPFLRTGDLGFVINGELFITGRLKDLIIIRGLNHYPQDIEQTVQRSHPSLASGRGVAFSIEAAGEEQLVVVQEINHRLHADVDEALTLIRNAVADNHELMPQAIVLVKPGSIPKTTSGKSRRQACRSMLEEGSLPVLARWQKDDVTENEALTEDEVSAPAAGGLPETGEEVTALLTAHVAAAVRMRPAEIDINQPIARYGINSLLAVELMHKAESSLGVSLPLLMLMQSPTISQMAEQVLSAMKAPVAATKKIRSLTNQARANYPLSRGQQALWYLHKLAPDSPVYHIAAAALVQAEIQPAALRGAFQELVNRHDSLRTTFSTIQGEPVQNISDRMEVTFNEYEASTWDEPLLKEQLLNEAHRPFDLEGGCLLRVSLFSRSPQEHILLMVAHHIVIDLWSLGVMMRELGLLYSASRDGSALTLPSLPVTYRDYALWQSEMLSGERGEQLWSYWEKQLSGNLPVLNLPTDRLRPPVQTFRGASHLFKLKPALADEVKRFSRSHGVTLYTTLLTAFQLLMHRYAGQEDILVGTLTANRKLADVAGLVGYFVNPVVIRAALSGDPAFESVLEQTRRTVIDALEHQEYPFPLLVERLQPARDTSRAPVFQVMFVFQKSQLAEEEELAAFALGESGAAIKLGGLSLESLALPQRNAQFDLTFVMAEMGETLGLSIEYNIDLFDASTIERMAGHFETLLESGIKNPAQRISRLTLLTEAERLRLSTQWLDATCEYPRDHCIHQQFEEQVKRTPEARAVIVNDKWLTYDQLNRQANQLAHYLRSSGVGPEVPVGICVERSPQMMVGLLAILKAGGAYVPLDPAYPKERLALIVENARPPVILTQEALIDTLPEHNARAICLEYDFSDQSEENPVNQTGGDNLAYIIYTSGSTGTPKGVMLMHRCVSNFFTGMDQRIGRGAGESLLAVTSISFDISVLELFWTLTRGVSVVLVPENAIAEIGHQLRPLRINKRMDFSLFYFATSDSEEEEDKYRLLLEGAKFADENGFAAVWTPERHFHAFGGLYPNPSVISAALAVLTKRVQLRAGSVVLPLHNPIRVAEEWSLVDNLSRGRVAIAFASGWHSDDFVFFPQNFTRRKDIMFEGIETLKKLWRGESITTQGGAGNELQLKIFPKPVQADLPIWITAAGTPETFVKAGEIGANVLTHLLGQTVEEVAERIRVYREALAGNGYDPQAGRVTLMLHTFMDDDLDKVRETVRKPFTDYLRASVGLISNMIKSLNLPLDLNTMSATDLDDLLAFAFNRYFETSALFGTPSTCVEMIERLKAIGVDEVACLVDFGVCTDAALAGLHKINELKEAVNDFDAGAPAYIPARDSNRPSLMQCTPSMMKMFMLDPEAKEFLTGLDTLMLGGEALPVALAGQIKESLPARLINMYGPTETTIWSATHEIEQAGELNPIGRAIANTQLHILDDHFQPVPPGVAGQLYIGGDGLARGYLEQPDLTATKFIPDPFSEKPGERLYSTGDLATFLPDGTVNFLGRLDYQVKIRGFRIETEEIELALEQHTSIKEAVVVAREDDPGDKRLVAYIVAEGKAPTSPKELRRFLKQKLPDYMIPSAFVLLERLPLTANGKVDRKALPAPGAASSNLKANAVGPRTGVERAIAEVWRQVLKINKVSIHDNFFDLGGHSLLMAQAHSLLREQFDKELPLIKLLEHPTISSLAKYIAEGHIEAASIEKARERALKQREGFMRRKQSTMKAR